MELVSTLLGAIITYFIIKFAVKNAIKESLDDIKLMITDSVAEGLSEHEYKKQNQ